MLTWGCTALFFILISLKFLPSKQKQELPQSLLTRVSLESPINTLPTATGKSLLARGPRASLGIKPRGFLSGFLIAGKLPMSPSLPGMEREGPFISNHSSEPRDNSTTVKSGSSGYPRTQIKLAFKERSGIKYTDKKWYHSAQMSENVRILNHNIWGPQPSDTDGTVFRGHAWPLGMVEDAFIVLTFTLLSAWCWDIWLFSSISKNRPCFSSPKMCVVMFLVLTFQASICNGKAPITYSWIIRNIIK